MTTNWWLKTIEMFSFMAVPDPGIELVSFVSPALTGRFFTTAPPEKPSMFDNFIN